MESQDAVQKLKALPDMLQQVMKANQRLTEENAHVQSMFDAAVAQHEKRFTELSARLDLVEKQLTELKGT